MNALDPLRRLWLRCALALPWLAAAGRARAAKNDAAKVIAELTGGAAPRAGRVQLELPVVADNGNSVPLRVSVDAGAGEGQRVLEIHLVSEGNPRPRMASFHLGAGLASAEIATRVRLAGTQRVIALARFADGSWWSGSREVAVTSSACYDGT